MKNSPESEPRPPAAIFVGVGVGSYDDEHFGALPRAVPDVTQVGEALAAVGYQCHIVADPGEGEVRPELQSSLEDEFLAGGSLIVLWAGHGEPTQERKLNLVAKNTSTGSAPNVTPETVAGIATRTGASQILLIFDTCYSGMDATAALSTADRVLTDLPPDSKHVWVGVLASAQELERAIDGAFGRNLLRLLKEGPSDPDLQRRMEHLQHRD